jgi:hypothetical protein
MKILITTVFLCASLGVATAQTQANKSSNAAKPAASARKTSPAAGRTECALASGLCVTVPAAWQRLGDVFEDLGFVVAEPHAGTDSATWPQLTVAAIDVPAAKSRNGAAARPSLDALVDIVLTPDGSFTSAETLQRSRLLLNGADAEMVRVQLHNDADKSEATEAVALIEGDEGLVYSIALRCAPEDFNRLEPVFQKAAHSWQIKPDTEQPAAQSASQSKAKQDSESK